MNGSTFSRFTLAPFLSALSLGKNHFAIKKAMREREQQRKAFCYEWATVKITSQYTLIKSESISNGREIYVLFFSLLLCFAISLREMWKLCWKEFTFLLISFTLPNQMAINKLNEWFNPRSDFQGGETFEFNRAWQLSKLWKNFSGWPRSTLSDDLIYDCRPPSLRLARLSCMYIDGHCSSRTDKSHKFTFIFSFTYFLTSLRLLFQSH